MSDVTQIEKILDAYHHQEWDLWYLGPCDEIVKLLKALVRNNGISSLSTPKGVNLMTGAPEDALFKTSLVFP